MVNLVFVIALAVSQPFMNLSTCPTWKEVGNVDLGGMHKKMKLERFVDKELGIVCYVSAVSLYDSSDNLKSDMQCFKF